MATHVVEVLAAGAKAAASGLAAAAVKDAYAGLKALVVERIRRKAAIEALEEEPFSGPQKAAVAEALAKSGASDDPEVQELAQRLARVLADMPVADANAMGLDIEDLQAANVSLRNIVAGGTAVRIRRTTVAGNFEAEGIRAGAQESGRKN